MSNLPPGVTDDMTDGYDPHCNSCGCKYSFHYDEEDIQHSDEGTVHACDHLVLAHGEKQHCPCTKFIDGSHGSKLYRPS